MKIGLIHGSLTKMGGAERVAIGFIDALNQLGIEPVVFTGDETLEKSLIKILFNKKVDFTHVKISSVKPRKFLGAYRNAIPRLLTTKLFNYDLVIDTSGLNISPIFHLKKMIRYVHNPVMHRLRESERQGVLWSLYRQPYEILSRWIPKNCLLLANSKFTYERIKKEWKHESIILYPPVELGKSRNKKQQFISIGRCSFEKRYEDVLLVAKLMPNYKFKICGTLFDEKYHNKIMRLARGLDNLEIITNATAEKIDLELSESKYFLHTMHNEDFGIAIVEAMSRGCIPIVHKSGGPIEIVEDEALMFENIRQVPKIIQAIKDEETRIIETMIKKSSKYSYDLFVYNVKYILENLIRSQLS
ncbi:MAG: glycosyltransferase [Candidatus Methanosuratincola sp.]|jgi:glycosyltransferase involved in cell wall biosynthesis